jgi:hypothetical protein
MEQFTQERADMVKMSQVMLEFSQYIDGYCQRADELQKYHM